MTAQPRSKTPIETATLDILTNGRDEMNLAEFPISVLADRAPKGTKTLIFRDGEATLTLTGSDAYGLPTAADADVIVALIQLTKQKNNFLYPTINFTRYELLRLLGWPNEGKSYRRLDESLNRWVGVSLHYDGCWWDNRSKQYGDAKIHIIESVVILDGKSRLNGDEQQALPLSSFTWNKVFMESCQADNLKRLNVETYFSLEHPSAKRLFRFLDKRFYRRTEWVFDLKEIAFERVGLSRNYAPNVGKIKEKLQPAIDELESRDFLQPMTRDERYFKDGQEWKIRLVAKRPSPALTESPRPEADISAVTNALAERGVTKITAAEIAQRHPAEYIQLKIEVFDWLVKKQDKRIAKSPAGYLVKSINEDFAAPKGFISKADQQRADDAKMAKERAEADERRRRQEAAAKERQKIETIAAYRKAQSPEQMARIEDEAIASATDEISNSLTDPMLAKFRRTLLASITDEFIWHRLQAEQTK
jgi:hypothetical protein